MSQRFLAELNERWTVLHSRVEAICPAATTGQDQPADASAAADSARMACTEAVAHHDAVRSLLRQMKLTNGTTEEPTGKWTVGSEYLDALKLLHRAEEALLITAPADQVIQAGVTDELRLMDSHIENKDLLLRKLRRAVVILGGEDYLVATPPAPEVPRISQEEREKAETQLQARSVLREVRYALNSYRDDRRDGMLRTRNQLAWTGMLTAAAAYIALVLAILSQAGKHAIMAAIAFFLIGAVVGLFDQLRALFSSDSSAEDGGLGRARVIYTPVLSGLAGIGGVVVTALLFSTLNGDVVRYPSCSLYFTPTPNVTATATATATVVPTSAVASPEALETEEIAEDDTELDDDATDATEGTTEPTVTPDDRGECARPNDLDPPKLSAIFNLDTNGFGFVVAAIFGLTPSLLVQRLQGEVKRYQADLTSTSSQG
jgi:hypothetical protein